MFNKCLELVRAYYAAGNSTGGFLHIVISDGNVDDGYIDYCEDLVQEEQRQNQMALEIIALLRKMTIAQRTRLYRES